jgi:peptidyl-prolyl cis-trans isomerase D
MAALETIRTKFGIGASLIIAFGLLLFLVNPSDIIQTIQSTSSKYDVGKINGKSISYTDFDQLAKKNADINSMLTGVSTSSEEAQREMREQTWQQLIQEYLVIPTIQKAGINVGQQEQIDLFVGDHISPVILNSGLFRDENGNVSPAMVREFMELAANDPSSQYTEIRNYLQNLVRMNRYTAKYGNLFTAASMENALQLQKSISENNALANVDFVVAPNTYYPMDTTIVISSAEIQKYYKDHKDSFRQNASRDIEYAVFEVVPSSEDVSAQNNEFAAQYEDFANAENVRAFLQRNSDRQLDERWYKSGELRSVNADVDAFVAENVSGISPVIAAGNTFYAARIMNCANVPDSVYVRHIMLRGTDAQHQADSLLKELKGNNFSTLATLYSLDQSNAADGEMGNLGWMTQNTVIPGMESLFTASKGKPFILNTQYGTHIVEVVKTTAPVQKKQVAIFEKTTLPSKETYARIYNQANVLATRAAGKYSNYKAACDSTGIYSRSTTINEATDTYGSIGHAKEVTRWCFDNKPGKASNIITVDNNYFFVAAVKEAHKEGFAKVEEVAEGIRTNLYYDRYSQKRRDEVAAQINGANTLEEAAEKLGLQVSSLTDVTFSTSSAATTEPAFVGAVAAAKENVLSGPVAGNIGTYVFRVNGRETGSFYTEDDARSYQDNINNYNLQMLLPVMMDKTVKDNRARFY